MLSGACRVIVRAFAAQVHNGKSCAKGIFNQTLLLRSELSAPRLQAARLAFGLSGCADIAAVKDEPVVSCRSELGSKAFGQIFFHSFHRGAVRKTYSVGNPENMGVNGNDRLIVNY